MYAEHGELLRTRVRLRLAWERAFGTESARELQSGVFARGLLSPGGLDSLNRSRRSASIEDVDLNELAELVKGVMFSMRSDRATVQHELRRAKQPSPADLVAEYQEHLGRGGRRSAFLAAKAKELRLSERTIERRLQKR